MAHQLFAKQQWNALAQLHSKDAIAEVERLSVASLESSGLAHDLERIAERHSPKVPVLHPEKKRGLQVKNMKGRAQPASMLEVRVPFTGDNSMFHVVPPETAQPVYADVEKNDLLITVPDDNLIQSAVDSAVANIQASLESLKAARDRWFDMLKNDLTSAAANRLSQLREDRDRYGKLDFPFS